WGLQGAVPASIGRYGCRKLVFLWNEQGDKSRSLLYLPKMCFCHAYHELGYTSFVNKQMSTMGGSQQRENERLITPTKYKIAKSQGSLKMGEV
ncbi:MAG: hypothetical protein RR285_07315, partial [Acinetobacter sp.]